MAKTVKFLHYWLVGIASATVKIPHAAAFHRKALAVCPGGRATVPPVLCQKATLRYPLKSDQLVQYRGQQRLPILFVVVALFVYGKRTRLY